MIVISFNFLFCSGKTKKQEPVHVYEIREIQLDAINKYDNPYKEVECWIELSGPDFNKKISGFWNGENKFVFRLVAAAPGIWSWKSFSNVNDKGLNGKEGKFEAIDWNESEILQNSNRHGFIRPTKNGVPSDEKVTRQDWCLKIKIN